MGRERSHWPTIAPYAQNSPIIACKTSGSILAIQIGNEDMTIYR